MKKYLLGIAVLFMAACSTSEDVENLPVPDENADVVEAFGVNADETRAILKADHFEWEKDDLVRVWQEGSSYLYDYETANYGKNTVIYKSGPGVRRDDNAHYYGVYGNVQNFEVNSGSVKFTLPSEQRFESVSSVGKDAHVMLGVSDPSVYNLKFYDITSIITVEVTVNTVGSRTIEQFELSVEKGPLAGEFTVTPSGDGFEMTPTYPNQSSRLTITGINEEVNTYSTLPLHFAVPAGTYSGVTLTMICSNGESYSLSNSAEFTVGQKQNVWLSHDPLTFDATKPNLRTYEIGQWYPSGSANPTEGDYGVVYYVTPDHQSGCIIASNATNNSETYIFEELGLTQFATTFNSLQGYLIGYEGRGDLTWRIPSLQDWQAYAKGRGFNHKGWLIEFCKYGMEYWTSHAGSSSQHIVVSWHGEEDYYNEGIYSRTIIDAGDATAFVSLVANFPAGAEVTYPDPEPELNLRTYEVGQWYPSGGFYPYATEDGPVYGMVYEVSEDGLSGKIIVSAGINGYTFNIPPYYMTYENAMEFASNTYHEGGFSWRVPSLEEWDVYNTVRGSGMLYLLTPNTDLGYWASDVMSYRKAVYWSSGVYEQRSVSNGGEAYVALTADFVNKEYTVD